MRRSVWLVIVMLMGSSLAWGGDLKQSPLFKYNQGKFLVSNLLLKSNAEPEEVDTLKFKNLPVKAAMRSALIPGWGQYYAGAKTKAYLFVAMEGLIWVGYGYNQYKGKEQEDEYENFAGTNWDINGYLYFLEKVLPGHSLGQYPNINYDEVHIVEDSLGFTHRLPDNKTQQYYEMIGKYDQFVTGWGDVNRDTVDLGNYDSVPSSYRKGYMDMRYDSNQLLKKASLAAQLVMINHLLSAMDAAWTLTKINRTKVHTSVRVEQGYTGRDWIPVAVLRFRW